LSGWSAEKRAVSAFHGSSFADRLIGLIDQDCALFDGEHAVNSAGDDTTPW
jgi:hypothetical protein